jgi:hypothetical protein
MNEKFVETYVGGCNVSRQGKQSNQFIYFIVDNIISCRVKNILMNIMHEHSLDCVSFQGKASVICHWIALIIRTPMK